MSNFDGIKNVCRELINLPPVSEQEITNYVRKAKELARTTNELVSDFERLTDIHRDLRRDFQQLLASAKSLKDVIDGISLRE